MEPIDILGNKLKEDDIVLMYYYKRHLKVSQIERFCLKMIRTKDGLIRSSIFECLKLSQEQIDKAKELKLI